MNPCPFCRYLDGTDPCAFVVRTATVSAFVNRTQYERGALLVVPNRHVATLIEASDEEAAEVARLTRGCGRRRRSEPRGVLPSGAAPCGTDVPGEGESGADARTEDRWNL